LTPWEKSGVPHEFESLKFLPCMEVEITLAGCVLSARQNLLLVTWHQTSQSGLRLPSYSMDCTLWWAVSMLESSKASKKYRASPVALKSSLCSKAVYHRTLQHYKNIIK
jgi:hypothetical protein